MSATNLASQAMRSLVGGDFQHMIANTDYDKFIVVGAEKPPKEVFEAKLQELLDAQPLKELRQERNTRLADVDWVFSEDYSIDDDSYQQWLTYRKALRDLPSLTEDPENPVWPSRPPIPTGTTDNKELVIRGIRIENIQLRQKLTLCQNKVTHLSQLLTSVIGRIETLERPT